MMLPWFSDHILQLTERYLAGRLHHGLLFAGPQGIGKHQFADEMARTLLCRQATPTGPCGACQSCALHAAGNHADYHVLESEKQLGVDAVREGIGKLNSTAQISRNKVLLIKAADTMTESASNALLKTLEEPTDNTYLILLSSQYQRLLPTILSRCEKHLFKAPPIEESLAWLRSQSIEADSALLNAYANAPLRLKQALENEVSVSFRDFTDGIAKLMAGTERPLSLAVKWQDEAQQIVSWCEQQAYKDYLDKQSNVHFHAYEQCKSALARLRHPGVNKLLILTSVLENAVRT